MELKLVIGTKEGKSYQKELKSPEADIFAGKKIGDKIDGRSIAFEGYEFEITGGSDKSGFPMRTDVQGLERKRILTAKSLGVKTDRDGKRVRKTVAGNTISEQTAQINLKITKAGAKPLEEPKEETGEEKPVVAEA